MGFIYGRHDKRTESGALAKTSRNGHNIPVWCRHGRRVQNVGKVHGRVRWHVRVSHSRLQQYVSDFYSVFMSIGSVIRHDSEQRAALMWRAAQHHRPPYLHQRLDGLAARRQ